MTSTNIKISAEEAICPACGDIMHWRVYTEDDGTRQGNWRHSTIAAIMACTNPLASDNMPGPVQS